MSSRYISVIFPNRNDNYGGDQKNRIQTFIDYFSYFDKKYPDLFDMIVCDWNPPQDKLTLKEAYNWDVFTSVKFLTIPPEIHQIYSKNSKIPILEYIARNACIRRISTPFIMLANQDVFPTESMFAYLAQRKLSSKYFYRADRCDFHFDQITNRDPQHFETEMKKYTFQRHRRYRKSEELSPHIRPEQLDQYATSCQNGERYDSKNHIIYSQRTSTIRTLNKLFSLIIKTAIRYSSILVGKDMSHWIHYYIIYQLHTNASGDFLIASPEAFAKIYGFPETTDFYMHTDSYGCVQLFVAGYNQAIFVGPHAVFHADHSRLDRADRVENISFNEHAKILSKMCCYQKDYRLNSTQWGLSDYKLTFKT